MPDSGGIRMDPTCPRCDGKHGVEVSGDGYEWDCAACGQHLICAIGPDGGEMYAWYREDGSCGCDREPHTCDLDEEERAELKRDRCADFDAEYVDDGCELQCCPRFTWGDGTHDINCTGPADR